MGQKDSKKYLVDFGKNLKKLRIKKKLSLRKLAAACNVDHSDIGKIEKGEINITFLTLLELANGLEVHPEQLLNFEIDLNLV